MYVTRPLSLYKRDPSALSDPPPSRPNSGYLVLFDDEGPRSYTLFGYEYRIKHLPFPQNKNLTVIHYYGDDMVGEKVLFIPVLNQPLSSNCYYVIRRKWTHQGQAITSSKEEDTETCFCCILINDAIPRPLDPLNDYQQFEIIKDHQGFYAKSIATDGIPPDFLRRKGWRVDANTPKNYHLNEALGSNDTLRSQLPDFNFPLSNDRSESVVVGKWYCPFMFVKERTMTLKQQMEKSVFYELTLQQRWEKIFSKENGNNGDEDGGVLVDVVVKNEVAKVEGGRGDAVWDQENGVVERVLWFKSFDDDGKEVKSVGLSLEITESMKWEQERVGWVCGNDEREVRVLKRVEKHGGRTQKWNKFSCYVLVESFLLKQMTGKLVLTCDFNHTQQIRCKWE